MAAVVERAAMVVRGHRVPLERPAQAHGKTFHRRRIVVDAVVDAAIFRRPVVAVRVAGRQRMPQVPGRRRDAVEVASSCQNGLSPAPSLPPVSISKRVLRRNTAFTPPPSSSYPEMAMLLRWTVPTWPTPSKPWNTPRSSRPLTATADCAHAGASNATHDDVSSAPVWAGVLGDPPLVGAQSAALGTREPRVASQQRIAPPHTMAAPCQNASDSGARSSRVDSAADSTGMK